ncbi:MAG: ABC-2 transporter permease, partial [Lachnospiraceae bacterium]|nr:ABC-2 transporter permease [Lachnospiraceae bacterium]
DLRLLGQQKKLGIMYIFLAVFLSFSMDSSFVVSYMPMIALLLVFSTISYDNYDNGMPFLMTLPVNGKAYAVEKYLLASGALILTWIVAVVLQIGTLVVRKEAFSALELLGGDFIGIPIFLIVVALMIPIELKFGTDKGRLVIFAIFGIAMVIVIGGKGLLDFLQQKMGLDLNSVAMQIKALPFGMVIAVVGGISILLLVVSVVISIGIMEKKEY